MNLREFVTSRAQSSAVRSGPPAAQYLLVCDLEAEAQTVEQNLGQGASGQLEVVLVRLGVRGLGGRPVGGSVRCCPGNCVATRCQWGRRRQGTLPRAEE